MRICEHCLQALRSHGEKVYAKVIYVDENDPEESTCEFCGEDGNDTMFDL